MSADDKGIYYQTKWRDHNVILLQWEFISFIDLSENDGLYFLEISTLIKKLPSPWNSYQSSQPRPIYFWEKTLFQHQGNTLLSFSMLSEKEAHLTKQKIIMLKIASGMAILA
ncbi:MAG: hypothetical protein Q9M50_00860 [Methylococcales bacterium]|nr:hypothetical protein [Methylococcales bacterium]